MRNSLTPDFHRGSLHQDYSDGSDTYTYYPNNLDNAGTLTVLHQDNCSTIMDYNVLSIDELIHIDIGATSFI